MKTKPAAIILLSALFLAAAGRAPAAAAGTSPKPAKVTKDKPQKTKTSAAPKDIANRPGPPPVIEPPVITGNLTGISLLYLLGYVIVYFAPTLVAQFKKRKDPVHYTSLFYLVAGINTFFGCFWLGWGTAWLIVLTDFFGRFTPERDDSRFVGWTMTDYGLGSGQTPAGVGCGAAAPVSYPAPAAAADDFAAVSTPVCRTCSGSGSKTCPSCRGRGSWYEPPRSAYDMAHLVYCSYCSGSGQVQCTH